MWWPQKSLTGQVGFVRINGKTVLPDNLPVYRFKFRSLIILHRQGKCITYTIVCTNNYPVPSRPHPVKERVGGGTQKVPYFLLFPISSLPCGGWVGKSSYMKAERPACSSKIITSPTNNVQSPVINVRSLGIIQVESAQLDRKWEIVLLMTIICSVLVFSHIYLASFNSYL